MERDMRGEDGYDELLELEELESIQEELEEQGIDISGGLNGAPEGMRERLMQLNINNLGELVSRIAQMNAELDEADL